MNKLFSALLIVLIALSWASCRKEMDVKDPAVSNEEMTVSGSQARFSWCVDFTGSFQTGVELSPNENMTELRRVEATKEGNKYVAVIDGLSMGTKYYYRIVVWNKLNNYEQEMKDFATSPTYTVNLLCNPEEGGTALGGGTFAVGDTCVVVATANVGYNFVNWTENESQVSTEAEYKFTVTTDRNLVAHFTSQEYTITATAEPSEGGIVSGSGGYDNGDVCTLTATPNEGYAFVNWTKDGTEVSANPIYIFAVTETAVYVAHFQVHSYTITVASNSVEGGSVEGGGIYEYGQSCTVRAIEANGYHFVNWTENGEQVSSDEAYTFTVTGNRDLVANFTSQQYTITVSANLTNGGSVTGGGTYYEGEQCTVTAIPADGYVFTTWYEMYYDQGGVSGVPVSNDANYTFTVNSDRTLKAHFTCQQYTITVSANPTDGGSVTGGGTYYEGEQCTVMAIPADGYTFMIWYEHVSGPGGGGLEPILSDVNYTFTVDRDRTLEAHFTSQQYTITATASPTDGGSVTGGGTYYEGEQCTVTAIPADGYIFTTWYEMYYDPTGWGGIPVSNDASYTFTVNSDRTLSAYFTHSYVDLDLPSGTLWATCNLGADAPEDYGDYFAWGEIQPKDTYNWSTYRYCMGSNTTLTKYCSDSSYGYNGFTDNLTVLQSIDDAATFNWGNGWRMPTKEEWQELINNTTNVWTIQNGVNGLLCTASNGNSLFLPAAGYRWDDELGNVGSNGYYWSSSHLANYPFCAWYLYFNSDGAYVQDYYYRSLGFSVRPVREN